jgi:hypothetical protein
MKIVTMTKKNRDRIRTVELMKSEENALHLALDICRSLDNDLGDEMAGNAAESLFSVIEKYCPAKVAVVEPVDEGKEVNQ